MSIKQEISLLISSDTANGAINKTADGSTFEIEFDQGFRIPREATNVKLTLETAEIWWSIPNITVGVNDTLYITGPDPSDVSTVFQVTIPKGLYDVSGLNTAIATALEAAGAKITPSPLITIYGDNSTQKVQLERNYAAIAIDFTQSDTFRDLMGFNSQVIASGGPDTIAADNEAAFNQINYFLINTSLVNTGLLINGSSSNTIGRVLITASPGSQITHQPFNPPKSNAQHLAGAIVSKAKFWVTDDLANNVNTDAENWSAELSIKYDMPR